MIYNLTDTFFVAQTQNANLVAGITLCTPLFSMMIALGDMFGLGGSSAISRLLGQKKYDLAGQVNSFCFYAAVVLAVIVITSVVWQVYHATVPWPESYPNCRAGTVGQVSECAQEARWQ